jgi:predicted LPLAT superfamily acyltransferase
MADRPLENQYELVPFFGKLAVFDATAFRMAEICKVPLFVSFGFKKDFDSYQFMAFRVEKGLGEYVELIERELIHYPDQWFNFYPFWSSPPSSPVALKSRKAQHHLQEEWNK